MSNQIKAVLLTGGSNGIGEATALEYAKLGYKVAITGRKQDRLNAVFETLVLASPLSSSTLSTPSEVVENFLAIKADFEDPSQVEGIVADTVAKFGRLDVLINNAGYVGKKRGLSDEDFFDDFKNIMQVNLIAATRLAQLATPHLLKTKGVIINISSIADRAARPDISYSVSKAGLTMLTNCLANSFAGTGVRVIAISPGIIETNIGKDDNYVEDESQTQRKIQFIPLRRIGNAAEVADTIVFLSSDKASYINGCTIDVDGGCLNHFGGALSNLAKPLSSE